MWGRPFSAIRVESSSTSFPAHHERVNFMVDHGPTTTSNRSFVCNRAR